MANWFCLGVLEARTLRYARAVKRANGTMFVDSKKERGLYVS